MKITICVLLFIATALSISAFVEPKLDEFKAWVINNDKTYENENVFNYKFEVYKKNALRVHEMNKLYNPKTTFGLNKFADLTPTEFRQQMLSPTPMVAPKDAPMAPLFSQEEVDALPKNFDWRPKGAVTPVKNQGQCGSCWSFSTTGNVEGQWFLKGHKLVGLSEQNLVDCDHHCMIYENQKSCDAGCNGGLMPNAFSYIIQNGGIDSEASYPYEGFDSTCRFKKSNVAARISNYTMISHDENQMAAYLYKNGPISIAADAAEWQFYVGGVFYLPCGKQLDHGILIVGYGVETDIFDRSMPYWIVKNSWGADWGESGYLRIERGTGECGLNTFPCSSIV